LLPDEQRNVVNSVRLDACFCHINRSLTLFRF
jgi:hypothetical protein